MSDPRSRLVKCFRTVFHTLPEDRIPSAAQMTTPEWDSVSAITLVNVIEEEFAVQMDYERLADLDTFPKILQYLQSDLGVA